MFSDTPKPRVRGSRLAQVPSAALLVTAWSWKFNAEIRVIEGPLHNTGRVGRKAEVDVGRVQSGEKIGKRPTLRPAGCLMGNRAA